MNFDHLLVKCEEHVSTIKWESDKMISVFETTIRYLGGLISAYDVTGKEIYLKKAKELSTYLLPAFNSKSGLPYHETNTKTYVANLRLTIVENLITHGGLMENLFYQKLALYS
jgi:mannosyl-oligosaccharide alpha-1,2-mannosidase